MILERIVVGTYQVNCYILAAAEGGKAVIIDPGAQAVKIKKVLDKHSLIAEAVVNTHGHFDHIGSDDDFGVPVYAHAQDHQLLVDSEQNLSGYADAAVTVKARVHAVADGDLIRAGGVVLEVIHTPGHSPGGICLLLKEPQTGIVFCGDSVFYRNIGRTDFPGASQKQLLHSIREKIFSLPEEFLLYPGHGPATSVGEEKKHNPYA